MLHNNHEIEDVNDLKHALLVEWQDVANYVIYRLTISMRMSISTCIMTNSDTTRYCHNLRHIDISIDEQNFTQTFLHIFVIFEIDPYVF